MKRILSLILVLVFLLSAALLTFTSCGEEEGKAPEKTPSGTSDLSSKGDMFAERAAVSDELGEYDFGGRKFRIVTNKPREVFGNGEEMRNQGDLITDATLERNDRIEKRFNCDIDVVFQGNIYQLEEYVSKTVLSGVDEFDLYIGHSGITRGLFKKNLFINWYDIPNVNFDKPWWTSSTSDVLTVDGKCALAISDLCNTTKYCTMAMFFNKNLASSYDLGNLYKVALDGEWTYDYFYSLIKDVYVDEDGDGKRSFGDFYGYAQGNYDTLDTWMFAFDNPIAKKDADGIPKIAIKTDKVSGIFSTIYDLCWNTNGTYFYQWKVNNIPSDAPTWQQMFINKQTIFTTTYLNHVLYSEWRNFEDDYGILPMPKLDENQKDYYTYSFAEHTVLAVPKTAQDLTFVGTIVEALSAESYKQLTPTFYEIALKTRYLRDNESKKVLDIIIDGTVYDFAYVYGTGIGDLLSKTIMNKQYNFESNYAKYIGTAKNNMRKIIKVYDSLE